MKRSDRTILFAVLAVAAVAVFWMLILSPKRDEAKELESQVSKLQSSVAQQEQLVTFAQQARDDFDHNYRRMVVLGKGVPADSDTPSLLLQVQHLADDAGVEFKAIQLSEGSGTSEAAAVATPPPLVAPGDTSSTDSSTATATSAEAMSAAPTEASAASLPIGATVGPAGLGVMPYNLTFTGGFFQVASFLGELDDLIDVHNDRVAVAGRLLTVDGLSMTVTPATSDQTSSSTDPELAVTLKVTSYVTPVAEGITAGATTAGPAATTTSTSTTSSSTTSTETPAP